jgi:hypothetical protein
MRPVKLFLFNDALMITKKRQINKLQKKQKPFKFVAIFPLTKTHMVTLADRGISDGFQIESIQSDKKVGPIKLGDENLVAQKKFKLVRALKNASVTPEPSTAEIPNVMENENYIIHAFRTKQMTDFIVEFRKAKENLSPRTYSSTADIYRKWTDKNADYVFHVYHSLEDYKRSCDQVKQYEY